MAGRLSFGRLTAQAHSRPGGEGAFRILLLGDFSARTARGAPEAELGRRAPRAIDVDNYEQVLSALGAELHLPAGAEGASITIRPTSLDDLHPEQLFDELEVFQALRALRKRLRAPATFPAAAAEVWSWAGAPEPPGGAPPPAEAAEPTDAPASESRDDVLGRLLGDRPTRAEAPAAPAGGIDSLIRGIVGPHVVPDTDRDQAVLLGRVDEAVATQMRAILHHPGFQALEAAWRSVHLLVTSLETDEELQLFLLDVSRDELAADLTAGEALESTALYRLLVEQTVGTPGGRPWAAVAAAFRFDKTVEDTALLGRIARIAAGAGAPFLAAAHDRVVGAESLAATPDPEQWTGEPDAAAAEAWAELRRLPEAKYLALALPRLLLRLPYGPDTDPIDRFEFEELAGGGHECYLWGNPAFALAQMLGAGFAEHGWALAAQLYHEIGGLPMHVFTADGETHVMPCAEVYLTNRAGERIQEGGITAVLSVQGRDAVLIRGIASLAEPVTALAGRWSG